MQSPYSVHIYLPDGSPDGVQIMTKDNVNIALASCPRSLITNRRNLEEFNRPGIYILLSSKDDVVQRIYIGEGDPTINRLIDHNAKKDFWTKVVCCTTTTDHGLDKAEIQYLESRLCTLAAELKIADLDNGNSPQLPTLSPSAIAKAESFLSTFLELAPLMGIDAFEKPNAEPVSSNSLFIKNGTVSSEGYVTAQGFLVKKGSEAMKTDTPSLLPSSKKLRTHLLESGVLLPKEEKLVFTQDYVFRAPSPAAEVILGRSESGRRIWKDKDGKTLAELQEAMKQ
jgi:hypothetical protein